MSWKDEEWQRLERALDEAARAEIRAFAERHPTEEFYAFAFDCNALYGDVLLCLNTRDEVEESVERAFARPPSPWGLGPPRCSPSEYRASLECNPGDWRYQGFEEERGHPGTAEWREIWMPRRLEYRAMLFDLSGTEHPGLCESPEVVRAIEAVAEAFLRVACRVALRLQATGVFEDLRRTHDFRVFCADHDEDASSSWARLDAVWRPGTPAG